MLMPGRKFSSGKYRYGYAGKDGINEAYEDKVTYDFGSRVYDARISRWLSVDFYLNKYPGLSPYNNSANSPIVNVDIDGKDYILKIFFDEDGKGQIQIVYNVYTVSNENKKEIEDAMSLWKALNGTQIKLNDQLFTVSFITNTTQKETLEEAKSASSAERYSNVYGGNSNESGMPDVTIINRVYILNEEGGGAKLPELELGPVAVTNGNRNYMWYKSFTLNSIITKDVADATGRESGTTTEIKNGNS